MKIKKNKNNKETTTTTSHDDIMIDNNNDDMYVIIIYTEIINVMMMYDEYDMMIYHDLQLSNTRWSGVCKTVGWAHALLIELIRHRRR